jgi:hypothetical protein
MSVYQKFNNTTNVFNSSDIVGTEKAESGMTTIKFDMSSFVQRSAPFFDNDLYLKDNVKINFQGKVQESAYDEDEKLTNSENKTKLSNVQFDGTSTKIIDTLDLRDAALLITDEVISINKF